MANIETDTNALLQALADGYIDMPFRMHELLPVETFLSHLRRREIHVSRDDLEQFERHSLLFPLLRVSDPTDVLANRDLPLRQVERFAFYRKHNLIIYPALDGFRPWSTYHLPVEEAVALDREVERVKAYYHPYQTLWVQTILDTCSRNFRLPYYWDDLTIDEQWVTFTPERYHTFVAQTTDPVDPPQFYRLLLLLLLVDGSYLPDIRSRWPSRIRAWRMWRGTLNPAVLLQQCGLTVEHLKQWWFTFIHRPLFHDPLREWYALARHATYDKRQKLKGEALVAQDRYELCELLRTLVKDVSGEVMVSEDDITDGTGGSWKTAWYGVQAFTYRDTGVLRKILAEYGLNTDRRLYWVVEGQTEEEFVKHFLAAGFGVDPDTYGMRIVNAEGINNIDLRKALTDARDREVLATVTLDDDDQSREVLAQIIEGKWATAGYHVWKGDFEGANFSDDELAAAAVAYAARVGTPIRLTDQDIAAYRAAKRAEGKPKAAGEIVKNLCGARGLRPYSKKELGWQLAEQMLTTGSLGNDNARPIERLIARSLRLSRTSFHFYTQQVSPGPVDIDAIMDIYESAE